jgi:type III pantothenate kinase
MKLLLDVGNSRLKWAQAEGHHIVAGAAQEHGGDPAAAVAAMPDLKVEAIWISNVTGAALGAPLAAALGRRYGVEARFAAVAARHAGLAAAYAEPKRLGVDRWLCLLAAWTQTRAAACVASAGTALTFDAVDASGRHLGGIIAPGLTTMQQAVLGATRFAAAGPNAAYTEGLGTDTEACVRQGALHAAAGALDRLAGKYGAAAPGLLTGGDAEALLPHLGSGWSLRPNLVLEGLLALAQDSASS